MGALGFGSVLLAAIVLIPVLVVCVECLAALLPAQSAAPVARSNPNRAPVVVIIPAHNEAAVIERTLRDVCALLLPGDRLVVVADNCTDRTAELACGFPAEVIVRNDLGNVGKGFALDFAARYLETDKNIDQARVVVVIDADCGVSIESLNALATQVTKTRCAAQAIYTMDCPEPPARPGRLVSTLAFLFKNQVRPHGLNRLGLPCALTGSGMAFPWAVFRDAPLATACIVEDMQLGIDLLIAHQPTLLCEGARITGTLPDDRADAVVQRTRWEHGHLRVALMKVPQLLVAGLTGFQIAPLVTALDLAVPPLSLLIMTLGLATTFATGWAVIGQTRWPLQMLFCGDVALFVCLVSSWLAFGRSILPLVSFLAIPKYVVSKFPVYVKFIVRRQTRWVSTPRDKTRPPDPPESNGGTMVGSSKDAPSSGPGTADVRRIVCIH